MGYQIQDISYRDLDEYLYSGVYSGFNIDNAPDVNHTQAIVTRHNESWIVQECKNYIDRIFLRSFKNDMWSKWTELILKPDDCDKPDHEVIVIERPHTHPVATPQNHGLMSAEDKTKLDLLSVDGMNPENHIHEQYEEQLEELTIVTKELNKNKADIEHEHDERYINVISSELPTIHKINGQVWIQTF